MEGKPRAFSKLGPNRDADRHRENCQRHGCVPGDREGWCREGPWPGLAPCPRAGGAGSPSPTPTPIALSSSPPTRIKAHHNQPSRSHSSGKESPELEELGCNPDPEILSSAAFSSCVSKDTISQVQCTGHQRMESQQESPTQTLSKTCTVTCKHRALLAATKDLMWEGPKAAPDLRKPHMGSRLGHRIQYSFSRSMTRKVSNKK